jgi:hypothetical protein
MPRHFPCVCTEKLWTLPKKFFGCFTGENALKGAKGNPKPMSPDALVKAAKDDYPEITVTNTNPE